jgi:hypothetical protein
VGGRGPLSGAAPCRRWDSNPHSLAGKGFESLAAETQVPIPAELTDSEDRCIQSSIQAAAQNSPRNAPGSLPVEGADETRTGALPRGEPGANLAALLRVLARLPLSDAEKAAAVRKLLARDAEGDKM